MTEDGEDRTQEIALDEVEASRRSGPPPLPSRRAATSSADLEPESSDRPTDPPPSSAGGKPPARLGRSLAPPPLAAAVLPPRGEASRAETPRSSRATVKLKPVVDPAPAPRPSVPPPLAGGLGGRTPAPTSSAAAKSPSDASLAPGAPASTLGKSKADPSSSASSPSAPSAPSTTAPSTTASSSAAPSSAASSSAPSTATASTATPSTASFRAASTPPAASATPAPEPRVTPAPAAPTASTAPSSARAASTPRTPSLPPPSIRPALATRSDRPTTTSLADAALQARVRHLEAQADELPKWQQRLAALEGDPRFDALSARLDELATSLDAALSRVDSVVGALAPLIERVSALESTRDDKGHRARLDRAMDLATAAHEATRATDARFREQDARAAELASGLEALRDRVDSVARVEPAPSDAAALEALEERLSALERTSDAALRGRVEALEARLVSLVARFADIAAHRPEGARPSLLPPPPSPEGPELDLEARVRELVRRELETRVESLAAASSAAAPSGDALRSVKGIGPAFAERLRAQGITDVALLASLEDDALPALAEAVGVPLAKLRKWRDAAKK